MPLKIALLLLLSGFAQAETKEWNNNLELAVTRCFQAKDISVICEDDFLDNELKPSLKEINLVAKDRNGYTYSYSYGRALPALMCDRHSAKIKNFLKDTSQACITGDAETQINKNETTVKWLAFETRKGEVHRNRD